MSSDIEYDDRYLVTSSDEEECEECHDRPDHADGIEEHIEETFSLGHDFQDAGDNPGDDRVKVILAQPVLRLKLRAERVLRHLLCLF